MKLAIGILIGLAMGAYGTGGQQVEKQPMLPATIEHHKSQQVIENDNVEVKCPEGYEGHWVLPGEFGAMGFWGITSPGEKQSAYTICFDKKFMEQIRKNPELLRVIPVIRGA